MILNVENVSVRYLTGDFRDIGLKDYVLKKLTGKYEVKEQWAVKNVSFSLDEGDFLGIIGTNGAGKSTILKAISGVMKPRSGKITANGNISALLELGTGFDNELTLRENIYLRGAFLGYSREMIDEKCEEILKFAELKEFENRSYKQLSSGMKSRLAFSISCLVNPDILILDEVLSVGDGSFRKKSEEKMFEIIKGGATTIFVSHSLAQIKRLCNKVLWLHKGEQIAFGEAKSICAQYEAFLSNSILPGADNAVAIEEQPEEKTDPFEVTPVFGAGKPVSVRSGSEVQILSGRCGQNPVNFSELPLLNITMIYLAQCKAALPNYKMVLLITNTLERTLETRKVIAMAEALKQQGMRVTVLSLRHGVCKDDLSKRGIPVMVEPSSLFNGTESTYATNRFINLFDYMIFHTIHSLRTLDVLKHADAYKLFWTNEGREEFGNVTDIRFDAAFDYMDGVFSGSSYTKSVVDQYISEPAKSQILLYGDAEPLPAAVHSEEPAESRGSSKLLFTVIGTLCRKKGQDIILQALDLLPKSVMQSLTVHFVGNFADPEIQAMLEEQSEKYDNIVHTPALSFETIKETILSKSDVVLCASRDDSMPFFERHAMSMGIPAAVSAETGLYSMIEHGKNGYLFPSSDPDAVAQVIAEIAENAEKLRNIGAAARETYYQRFSAEKFQQNLKIIFKI